MSIAKLKRERSSMIEKINAATKSESPKDSRFWKPFLDKEKGTGHARIRFLPPADGEDIPFINVFKNSFKGPSGKYYINNNLTTLGKKDPCQELVNRCFNSGIDQDKKAAREAGIIRSKKYYANVLVIEDPANRENEGKVFIYQFGPKIWEMVQLAMNPEFADQKPIQPFDFWDGADFVLRIRKIKTSEGEQWNYDQSKFDAPAELFAGDDEKKEKVYAQCHKLQDFIAPTEFKTYEELQKQLRDVLGPYIGSGIEVVMGVEDSAPAPQTSRSAPARQAAPSVEKEVEAVPVRSAPVKSAAPPADDEDDDMAFFMKSARS